MRFILVVLIITAVTAYTFSVLPSTIFQQDEWLGLGGAITRQETGGLSRVVHDMFIGSGSRFLPVTSLINYLVFTTFRYNFPLYGYFSMALAITNAALVYFFVGQLAKSRLVALLTALFWVTNGISFQAISWFSTVVPSQFSFMFMLLALLYFLRYLAAPKPKLAVLVISLTMVSLLSKESGIFYLVTFPILALVTSPKPKSWPWLGAIIFTPFFVAQFLPGLVKSNQIRQTFYNLGSINNTYFNLLAIPTKSLFQSLVPIRPLYSAIYLANSAHYTNLTDGFVVESIIGDVVSLLGSCLVLLLVALALCLVPRSSALIAFVSLSSFVASCLPFIFLGSLSTILEPRFYIFPVLWVGLLIFTLVYSLISLLRLPVVVKHGLLILAVLPLLGFHIRSVKKYMQAELATSQTRLAILNTIKADASPLTSDTIFYFFTTNTGFYEFQSGTGQMLATWLHASGKIPTAAMTDLDFWEPSYEGVKSFSTGKYGYFMTFAKLVAAFNADPTLATTSVHAYYWNTTDNSVTNVSGTVRAQLTAALKP